MRTVRIIDHSSFAMTGAGPFGSGVPSQEEVDKAERVERLAQLESGAADRRMKTLQLERAEQEHASGVFEAKLEAEKRQLALDAQNAAVEDGVRAGKLGVAAFLSDVRPTLLSEIQANLSSGNTEGARLTYAKLQAATSQVDGGLSAVASYTGQDPMIASLREQAVAASNRFIGATPAAHQESMNLMNPALNPNSVAFSTTKNLRDNPSLTVEDARIKAEAESPSASPETRAQFEALTKLGVYGDQTVVAGPDGRRKIVTAPPSEESSAASQFFKSLVPQLTAGDQISPEDAIKTAGQITSALVKTQLGKNAWAPVLDSAKSLVGGLAPDQMVGAIEDVSTGLAAVVDSSKVTGPDGKIYANPLEQATTQQFAVSAFGSAVKSLSAGFKFTPGDSSARATVMSKVATALTSLNSEFKGMGIAEDMASGSNAKLAGELAAQRAEPGRASALSAGAQQLLAKIELARKLAGNAPSASPIQEALGGTGAESLSGLARTTETALQKHIMKAVVSGADASPASAAAALDAASEPIAQELATRYGLSMDQTRPLADAYVAAKKIDPNATVDAIGAKLTEKTKAASAQPPAPAAPMSDILVRAAAAAPTTIFSDSKNRTETFVQGLTEQMMQRNSPAGLNAFFTISDLKDPTSPKTQARISEYVESTLIKGTRGMPELVAEHPELRASLQKFVANAVQAQAGRAAATDKLRQADVAGVSDNASLEAAGLPVVNLDLLSAKGYAPVGYLTEKSTLGSPTQLLVGELDRTGAFDSARLAKAIRTSRLQKSAASSATQAAAQAAAQAAETAKTFGDIDSDTLKAARAASQLVRERMNLSTATVLGKKALAECDKTIANLTNVAPASGAEAQGILLKMLSDGESANDPAAFVQKFNSKIAKTLEDASRLVIQAAAAKTMAMQQARNGELPIDLAQ